MSEARRYVISDQEFIEGVMMALWELGYRRFNLRQRDSDDLDIAFDLSMEQAAGRLPELLGVEPTDLWLGIHCHPIHGDSSQVRAAVRYEVRMENARDEYGHELVLTYSAEFVRLRRQPRSYDVELGRQQIDPEIFRTLARSFVADYSLPRECRRYVRQVGASDFVTRHILKSARDDGAIKQLADL